MTHVTTYFVYIWGRSNSTIWWIPMVYHDTPRYHWLSHIRIFYCPTPIPRWITQVPSLEIRLYSSYSFSPRTLLGPWLVRFVPLCRTGFWYSVLSQTTQNYWHSFGYTNTTSFPLFYMMYYFNPSVHLCSGFPKLLIRFLKSERGFHYPDITNQN